MLPFHRLRAILTGGGWAATATGVLFDSSAGDSFSTRFVDPSDATLTISAGSMAFNSATPKALFTHLKHVDGTDFHHCFDDWTISATLTMQSMVFDTQDTSGIEIGTMLPTNDYRFGMRMRPHSSGYLGYQFIDCMLNGSNLGTIGDGVTSFAPGDLTKLVVRRNQATHTVSIAHGAAAPTSLDTAMVFAATSYQLPSLFRDFSMKFLSGNFAVTALKIEIGYPNATYAFVGDSLTQGRFASSYAGGYAATVRATYSNTLICGAPAAKISDWAVPIESVKVLNPKNVFIMLGTNDHVSAVSLATMQSGLLALIAKIKEWGGRPILISIPPISSADVRPYNTWLSGLGYTFIDIFTPLKSGAYGLNATYDYGDGIHLNTAGYAVVSSEILSAISANGIA